MVPWPSELKLLEDGDPPMEGYSLCSDGVPNPQCQESKQPNRLWFAVLDVGLCCSFVAGCWALAAGVEAGYPC